MSSVARKLLQVQPSAAEAASDDDFANVVLLLDGDGTSGDNNETFTDSSTNGYTITESGSVVQGSFSPYGDNWSVYFDSTAGNQYLQVADSSTFDATTSLCIEAWFYMTTAPGSGPDAHAIVSKWVSTTPGQRTVFIDVENTGLRVMFDIQGASNPVTIATDGGAISLNEWHHVAVTWDGSTYRAFLDGVLEGSTSNSSAPIASSQVVRVGYNTNTHYFGGYISNVRWVTNGGAVYTSNFTPPTSPLTAISGTALLLNSTNRFVDESSNNHTVTINGTPKVTPFSPFKDDDARDITTDGGSAYFNDSTSTYLSLTNITTPRTDSFTIEFWAYFLDAGASGLFQFTSNLASPGTIHRPGIHVDSNGNLKVYGYGSNTDTGVDIVPNQWYHIALSRSGSTLKTFVNGVITNDATDSEDFNYNDLLIGKLYTTQDMNGYISDFRYVKGAAVYTSAFTPPTEPVDTTVGSAYSISAASYTTTISVATQDASPRDVFFKPDGTKMYVVGAAYGNIYQYSLSTAWDVSTATYDSKSLSTSSEETTPTGMFFKPDGTSIIIVGSGNDYAFQYDLTTAWDVSTGSYASKSFDLSTQGSVPNGVALKPDGTKMFVIDDSSNNVFQYSLSTAWDVSTASYDSVSASVTSQASNPMALEFNADGTKMYIADRSLDRLHEYSLSTAWSLSSITHIATFKVNAYELNPSGIRFGDGGTKLYTSGYSGDSIDQYSVFSDTDLLLNFQDAGIYDRSGINNIDTVGNAQIDTAVKKYGTGSLEFDGTGDYIEASYVGDLFDFDTADWTMECWVYLQTDSDGAGGIIEIYKDDNNYLRLFRAGGPDIQLRGVSGGTTQFDIQSSAQSQNTWIHVAGVRDGATIRLFVDGTQVGTDTSFSIPDLSDARVVVGLDLAATDRYFTGYIDDLRITKGVARYTANFTPPADALPKF